jgi:hypothetical protein
LAGENFGFLFFFFCSLTGAPAAAPPAAAAAPAAAKPPPPAAAAAKPTSGSYVDELKDRLADDDPDERATKKEISSKTAGTKDGKNLLPIKKQWINYIGYRENYENNLRIVIDDGDTSKENKEKAKDLLNTLNEQYKLDAIEDLPIPTTTTNLTINKPRFVTNEAYKKEYIKRGKKLLKKIRESTKLDDEDNKNIEMIEGYFKLFD